MEFYRPDPNLSAVFKVYLCFIASTISKVLIKAKNDGNDNEDGELWRKLLGCFPSCKQYIEHHEKMLSQSLDSIGTTKRIQLNVGDLLQETRQFFSSKRTRISTKIRKDFEQIRILYNLNHHPRIALRQIIKLLQNHLQHNNHTIVIQQSQVELSHGIQFYTPADEKILQIETSDANKRKFEQNVNYQTCWLLSALISLEKKRDCIQIGERISDAIKIHKYKGKVSGNLTVTLYYCGIKHVVHMTTRLPKTVNPSDWLAPAYIEKAFMILTCNSYRILEKQQFKEYSSNGFYLTSPRPSYIIQKTDFLKTGMKPSEKSTSSCCFVQNKYQHCRSLIVEQNQYKIIDPIGLKEEILQAIPNEPATITVAQLMKLQRKVIQLVEFEELRYKSLCRFDLKLEVFYSETYVFFNIHQMTSIMSKMKLWNPTACLSFIIDNQTNKVIYDRSFIYYEDSCLKLIPPKMQAGEYTIVIFQGATQQKMPSRIEIFYDKKVNLTLIPPQNSVDMFKKSGGFHSYFSQPSESAKKTLKVQNHKKQISFGNPAQKVKVSMNLTYMSCILKYEIFPPQNITLQQLFFKYDFRNQIASEVLEQAIIYEKNKEGTHLQRKIEKYFFVNNGIDDKESIEKSDIIALEMFLSNYDVSS